MKLIHTGYNIVMELKENESQVFVIENRKVMQELIQELHDQCQGTEGRYILSSDDSKMLKLEKKLQLVVDPFSLECNERKILTALYQEIEQLALENMTEKTLEFYGSMERYINELCAQVPYQIEFKTEFHVPDIMKMVNVRIQTDAVSMLEKIIEYIGIMSKIGKYSIFVFVNLKAFLEDKELKSLYEYAFYNKIQLILLESTFYEKLDVEKTSILDQDRCIITL